MSSGAALDLKDTVGKYASELRIDVSHRTFTRASDALEYNKHNKEELCTVKETNIGMW